MIEAGPCPVVAVRTPDADGYEAVQLAYESVADRKISKAERGHLAKNGVAGAYRHLVEFRGHFSDAVQGENVTVEIFEPGDKVKVAGIGIGKGFQGTIKRHNFHRGPVDARLAQHPQAGLDRRERNAVARVQGHEDGRPDGRQARHADRPDRPLDRRRAQPAAREGRRPGPEERRRRGAGDVE